jgi:hypothetical protein
VLLQDPVLEGVDPRFPRRPGEDRAEPKPLLVISNTVPLLLAPPPIVMRNKVPARSARSGCGEKAIVGTTEGAARRRVPPTQRMKLSPKRAAPSTASVEGSGTASDSIASLIMASVAEVG